MNLMTLLSDINMMILDNRLQEAEAELAKLSGHDPVSRRSIAHFRGIVAFRKGDILAAKSIMDSAIRDHGPNVNILRDLIVCQYHLQDMTGFRSNLQEMERLLREKEGALSYRSLMECELMTGKFLEEEARLRPAMEFYERSHSRAQRPAHKLRALVQKARWIALYDPNPVLSQLYRELISVAPDQITQDLRMEMQHSLMLIELHLIGADHAWQRISRLSDIEAEIDQRLLIFDFLEGTLSRDLEVPAAVLEKMKNFTKLDPYEAFIAKLVQGELEPKAKIDELAQLAPQVSWSSYLRLLCLAANTESSRAVRVELHRKIQLIVRSLDETSQQLWMKRLKQVLQAPEIRLEYSARQRALTIQGRMVDLSKKKMGLQLLDGLMREPELSIDDAITLLWKTSFTPEHYHRLRMGIHRLNTLVNKTTGLGKIIEVDSQKVRLRPEVKIRAVDEGFASELMHI